MTLIVTVQGTQPIQVHTDTPVTSPCPPMSPMEMMVVVIASVQVPVAADFVPPRAVESLKNAQAIQMAAHAAVSTPDPSGSSIVVVAPVEMPVGADTTPMTLVITV